MKRFVRRIVGPKKDDNEYREFMNYEIINLMSGEDITNYIESQRLSA